MLGEMPLTVSVTVIIEDPAVVARGLAPRVVVVPPLVFNKSGVMSLYVPPFSM
jgi:hypothetical protein